MNLALVAVKQNEVVKTLAGWGGGARLTHCRVQSLWDEFSSDTRAAMVFWLSICGSGYGDWLFAVV